MVINLFPGNKGKCKFKPRIKINIKRLFTKVVLRIIVQWHPNCVRMINQGHTALKLCANARFPCYPKAPEAERLIISRTGCSLGIGDRGILRLLCWILWLMFHSLQLFLLRCGASFKIFSCNVTPFSCY